MQSNMQCGRYDLPLSGGDRRPLVMGILNVTPDSFSDGGQFHILDSALSHAERMIADGVDIIDIGAESTRPGVKLLPPDEELRRLLPVLYGLRDCGKPLSVDTRNPLVMRQALLAGADMINDVNGFRSADAVAAVADSGCGLCVMHMQNDPETMQLDPHYDDVVVEVAAFLQDAVDRLEAAGVERARICIDPGFGFGKNLDHNLRLLRELRQLKEQLRLPMLVGLSRKSIVGHLTGQPVAGRLAGSLAAALAAADRGADIIRVHDVAATVDALKVWRALT
ncbi:MAG: dihydropteroate synthase [Noviherbaspirillum sp.]